jgi:hypothetical protein
MGAELRHVSKALAGTVVAPPATVWGGHVSPAGKALWLGGEAAELVPGVTFETQDGTRDEVRIV